MRGWTLWSPGSRCENTTARKRLFSLGRAPHTDGAVSQHSHSYAEDGKVGSPEAPELGLVRTVAYPNGFSEEADGGIVR